jgi:hypothetical protein
MAVEKRSNLISASASRPAAPSINEMQRGKYSFSCTANPSGHDDRDFSRCGRASRLGDKNRWTLLAIWHRKRSLSWGKGANESVLGVARGNVDRAVAVPDRVCGTFVLDGLCCSLEGTRRCISGWKRS